MIKWRIKFNLLITDGTMVKLPKDYQELPSTQGSKNLGKVQFKF